VDFTHARLEEGAWPPLQPQ